VLSVEDWAEIRRLHRAEQMSISEVARVVGCSRNTVRAALASDAPPRYQRKPSGSIVDVVEPLIRELLRGASWDVSPYQRGHGERVRVYR
jgi:transposase